MESKRIKEFLETEMGAPMKEYLTLALKSMRSIERVLDIDDPIELAIELKAQKKAYRLIQQILDDIMMVEVEYESKEKPAEDSLVPGVEK